MKEAVGNALIFNWVIFFLFLMMFLFVGSLIYSRTFKIRNEVITIIEKNQGFNNITRSEINNFLGSVNYRQTSDYQGRTLRGRQACQEPATAGNWQTLYDVRDGFFYCVYHNIDENYYRVEVFLSLDLPIVGEFLSFPVASDTRRIIDFSR